MLNRLFWKDALERISFTFLEAFFGVLAGTAFLSNLAHLEFDQSALLMATSAGFAAVAALVKSFVAAKLAKRAISPASFVKDEVV